MERIKDKDVDKKVPSEDDVSDGDCADMLRTAGIDWTNDDRHVKEIAIQYGFLRPSPQRVMAQIATSNNTITNFVRKRGW